MQLKPYDPPLSSAHHAPHRRAYNRLAKWQKRLLLRTLHGLLLTGGVWLGIHTWTSLQTDVLPSPLESWLMKAHGLLSFLAMFSFGTLATVHIPRGWVQRHRTDGKPNHLRSALWLLTLWLTCIATAYILYYFSNEEIRPSLGWLHAGLGVALYGVLKVHSKHHP